MTAVFYAVMWGLILWIGLWGIGLTKALDSFLFAMLVLVLPATAWYFARPFVMKLLRR